MEDGLLEGLGQEGGGPLGGLFGKGGGSSIIIFLLLFQLLQGLLGGKKDQRGPAEEQPNFRQPSVLPQPRPTTVTSPFPPTTPTVSPTTSPTGNPSPSPSVAGAYVVLVNSTKAVPSAVTFRLQDALTVSNGSASTLRVGLRRQAQSILTEQDIASNESHRFRFTTAGAYELVVGTNVLVAMTIQ